MKNIKLLILFLLIAFATVYLFRTPKPERTLSVCFQGNACVKAELVVTPEEQARGLMNRTSIGREEGMLFIFQEDEQHTFWMKNTLIPLDMIWINSSKQVVHIEHAVPCERDPCTLYSSTDNSRYVLEVSANYTLEKNIIVGDLVSF